MAMEKVVTAAIALWLLSSTAQASTSTAGRVTTVVMGVQNKVFFYQNGVRTARPACSTNDRWVIDVSTTNGQTMVAGILTALSTGKTITINGPGACGDYFDTESVSFYSILA